MALHENEYTSQLTDYITDTGQLSKIVQRNVDSFVASPPKVPNINAPLSPI